ncbi:unnamed protein product, partial [Allacma fusca]
MTLNDVLDELNDTFPAFLTPVVPIQFSYSNGEISMGELPPDVEIRLPNLLQEYLGLPMDTVFTSYSKFPAKKELVEEQEEIEYEDLKPPEPKPLP